MWHNVIGILAILALVGWCSCTYIKSSNGSTVKGAGATTATANQAAPESGSEEQKPEPPPNLEAMGLKLLGVTSGTALVTTDRQSHHFTKGEARMLKTSKGFVLLKCVEMTTDTASFLVDDAKEPVHLRPPGATFKIPVSASR
jgi:hypothetical protein